MISFGLIHIYPYGLCIAVSAALALLLAGKRLRAQGMKKETLSVFAVLGLPLAFLFARLLYCLICIDGFERQGIFYLFDFTAGGYTMYGAILGGCLAALLTARHTAQSFARIADALAAPAALVIAAGRMAEGLVGQGYGWYIEDWFDPYMEMSLVHLENIDWLLRFPFGTPDMYGEWCWAIYVVEAVLALVIFALSLRVNERLPGETAMYALLMLACAQILGESLRQDAVLRFGFVRVNQVISALIIAALLAFGCIRAKSKKRILTACIATILGLAIVIIMEFALEKKVVLLESWPMDVCYIVTALACLGLVFSVKHAFRARA